MAMREQFDRFRLANAAAAVAIAFAVKLLVDQAPDAAVAWAFMRPAARAAAFYLGAMFDPVALTLTARGVTLEVVRACSATDFFAIVFTLFAFTLPLRPLAVRLAAALASGWLATVLSNSVRLILFVFLDGFFPPSQIPAIHMAVGITVFLTVFGILWHGFVKRKDTSHGNITAE